MARRRGAHIGADGRWWAVPAVQEQWNILNPLSWVLIFGLVFVAISGLVLLTAGSAAPSSGRGVLIAWIAMLVSVIVVVATIIATHRSRFRERLRATAVGAGGDVIPICATDAVARVPLEEMRFSERQYERFVDAFNRRNDADPPEATADVQEQMQDLQHLIDPGADDELDRARGLAALLRLMHCDSESVGHLSFEAFQMAPEPLVAKFPRIWLIDAVNIVPNAEEAPRPTATRRVRGARVLPEPNALQRRAAAWLSGSSAGATVLSLVSVFSGTIVSNPAFKGVFFGITGICALLLATSWLIDSRGPRWNVLVEDGLLTVRRKGVEESHPLRVRPESAWLVIYHRSDKAALGSRLPYTRPIWRFLFEEDPRGLEISNFDYRGTAWEPLMEEFLERQRQVADMGPPEGN